MQTRLSVLFQLILIPALLVGGMVNVVATPAQPPPRAASNARVLFIENVGQFPRDARFQVRGAGQPMWLTQDAVWITLDKSVHLKLSFPGGGRSTRVEPFGRQALHLSYLTGSDPARWQRDVPVWGGVRYRELYRGLDLEMTSASGRWSWRLICRHADCESALSEVRLRVEGAEGLALASDALHLTTAAGDVSLPLLQVVGAPGALKILAPPTLENDNVVAPFSLAAPSAAPQSAQVDADGLFYSTFLGDDDDDDSGDVALDTAGNVYVAGLTHSWDFPTTPGAYDTSYPILGDVYVAKLNPDGDDLVYATLLGGGDTEKGTAIAVDDAGNAYVTGYTASDNFPTTPGAFDTTYSGGYYPDDAFVIKLNPEGTDLVYSTFVAGGASDRGRGIAVDGAGNAYVVGSTTSGDFPTTPDALDPSYNPPDPQGESDAFLVQLDAAGSNLIYGTYLGTGADDVGYDVAVDTDGDIFVVGETSGADFPVTGGAFDVGHNGGADAFVVKLNADGSALDYGTYLGGSDTDTAIAVALDAAGNAYVTGNTSSDSFPTTAGAFDTSFGGGTCGAGPCNDTFVLQLDPAGSGLAWSGFLGGDDFEYASDIAVDDSGAVYAVGSTGSSDFPVTEGAFDMTRNDIHWRDVYVVKMNPAGAKLSYATLLGGSHAEAGSGIALNQADQVTIVGDTRSEDFPVTPAAFDTSFGGGECVMGLYPCLDTFVTKLETLPRFAISGRVSAADGAPLSGVQVAAGASYSATTAADGSYSIGGVLSGTWTLAPTTPGYFWSPDSRVVTGPPDETDQDFVASRVIKAVTPSSPAAVGYSRTLTYTVGVISPTSGLLAFYDAIPTHTVYVDGSLVAPTGLSYDSSADAISGTLDLTAAVSQTVSFAVRVAVTGTVGFAPPITNQACIRGVGGDWDDCEWSNRTWNFTYVWPVYLPIIAHD